MGFIVFVMFIVLGYVIVIRVIGVVDYLVESVFNMLGGLKLVGFFIMILLGFFIIMGIGILFGIVFVIVVIYVFFFIKFGFLLVVIVFMIVVVVVLGDVGFLVFDIILGLIVGLNVDG